MKCSRNEHFETASVASCAWYHHGKPSYAKYNIHFYLIDCYCCYLYRFFFTSFLANASEVYVSFYSTDFLNYC